MKIDVKPGKYVVAVSGGVDSMVLLDLLARLAENQKPKTQNPKSRSSPNYHLPTPSYQFIVAHFDHGIRPDSAADREFVEATANRIKIGFKSDFGNLGKNASEAEAREARYKFLRQVQQQTGSNAIITAHHQDDLLETAIINMLRGTNRRGLTSLQSSREVIRPLLGFTKAEILGYAKTNNLKWREDSTNNNDEYLRNYVRHQILSKFTTADRQKFLKSVQDLTTTNQTMEMLLGSIVNKGPIDRQSFISLPHNVAKEVAVAWLRIYKIGNYDKKTVDRLVIGAKTGKNGTTIDIISGWVMVVGSTNLALVHHER